MRQLAIVVIPLAVLMPRATSAAPITVSGAGMESCGKWTEYHQVNPQGPKVSTNDAAPISVEGSLMDQWLLGFVTSVNQFSPYSGGSNIQGGADSVALETWVSQYCVAHPLDPLVKASVELIIELRRRAHDEEPGMN